jgi:hypothetical protein
MPVSENGPKRIQKKSAPTSGVGEPKIWKRRVQPGAHIKGYGGSIIPTRAGRLVEILGKIASGLKQFHWFPACHKSKHKMKIIKPSTNESRIIALIANISANIVEVAALVRKEIEGNPEWLDDFCSRFPQFTPSAIRRLSFVGIKESPKLYFTSSSGSAALRRLPMAIQEKHAIEPIELLLSNGATLLVDIHALTSDQSAQVFASDHVRTLAEQRAWLEDKATKSSVKIARVNEPFRIVKNELVIMEPCKFTRKELLKILSDIG